MAITLQQKNTTTISSSSFASPFTLTLPGSYVTSAGDCIVIVISVAGTPTVALSGCGATWQTFTEDGAPELCLAVGYGCTAGGTTVSITGMSAKAGDIVVSVWSGLASSTSPVVTTSAGTSGLTSVSSVVTASSSYSVGQLVIGVGGEGGALGWNATTPAVWGNGATNTAIFASNSQRAARQDYQITASGTATTYTAQSANSVTMRAIEVVLAPGAAPPPTTNGSMFAVMGL